MTTFNINTEARNARIAEIEAAARQGNSIKTVAATIQFHDSRFHLNGKRISVGEAREFFAEMAEIEQVEAFEAEQAAIAAAAEAAKVTEVEVVEVEVVEHSLEMTVAAAAKLMNLSEVRIRRMTTEGKIRYGSRGYVMKSDVWAEMNRRSSKRAGLID